MLQTIATGFRAYYMAKMQVMIMMINTRVATIPTAIPAIPPPH